MLWHWHAMWQVYRRGCVATLYARCAKRLLTNDTALQHVVLCCKMLPCCNMLHSVVLQHAVPCHVESYRTKGTCCNMLQTWCMAEFQHVAGLRPGRAVCERHDGHARDPRGLRGLLLRNTTCTWAWLGRDMRAPQCQWLGDSEGRSGQAKGSDSDEGPAGGKGRGGPWRWTMRPGLVTGARSNAPALAESPST